MKGVRGWRKERKLFKKKEWSLGLGSFGETGKKTVLKDDKIWDRGF